MKADYEERVNEIISRYLKPNSHLLAAQRVHRHLTNEDVEFTRWSQVSDAFEKLDWDSEKLQKFATITKQVVESSDTRISESYFNVLNYNELGAEGITENFDQEPYDSTAADEEKTGFQYIVDDGIISGRHIHVDIETNITYSGEVHSLVTEKSVPFRIIPEDTLLVVESTSVVDIQRIKSAFGRKTNINISVCGSIPTYPEMGSKRISDFLDSLGEEVMIHEIRTIQLVNPRDSLSAISEMSIQGSTASDDLLSEPEVGERIDDGWLVKGVEFTAEYENEIFSVTVSGSEVMAYSKIENVADRMKGMMLMDVIRGYFLDNLRFQDTGRTD